MTTEIFQPLVLNGPSNRSISFAEYRGKGGYEALTTTLGKKSPGEVIQVVLDSGLRGQGGAGFPTGRKWSLLKKDAPFPRYVIANTDEMEPGTFKDRVITYLNPHAVIEGLIIAGYTVFAEKGFFFVRHSYEGSAQALEKALEEAREAGFLGKNILGSGYSLELMVHRSAGRYICGETKGLIHALEGKRPHPNIEEHLTSKGLWGNPTIINNVETLAYVPSIVENGAEWFRNQGKRADAPGHKIYTVSGRVAHPGFFELSFGTSLPEIIEDHAGGMLPGQEYKTCLPGGASTRYLPKAYYDIEMDFESFKRLGHGHRFGTGAIMVFDRKTCLVGATLNLIQFFARESCGFCTPCREGLPYIVDLLKLVENGEGKEEHIPTLHSMGRHLLNAYCDFATGAATPLLSLVEDFKEEIHDHISQRKCPFKS